LTPVGACRKLWTTRGELHLARLLRQPPKCSGAGLLFASAAAERLRACYVSVGDGRLPDQIAAWLGSRRLDERLTIERGLVRKHLENVYEKLGVTSGTAAVAALRKSVL
jgi:DNA-binding CsgD family transcriptional regulator